MNPGVHISTCFSVLICLSLLSHAKAENSSTINNTTTNRYALNEAHNHHILGQPVIMQRLFSPTLDESIIFMQLSIARTGKQPWKFEVRFVHSFDSYPCVYITNKQALLETAKVQKNDGRLNDAVLIAANDLDKLGRLRLPMIIDAKENNDQYSVTFRSLPEMPGGVIYARVSRDLHHCQFLPGY